MGNSVKVCCFTRIMLQLTRLSLRLWLPTMITYLILLRQTSIDLIPKLKKVVPGQIMTSFMQAMEDSQDKDFYKSGIEALQHRWHKVYRH